MSLTVTLIAALFYLLNANDIINSIQCNSRISSSITSSEHDDYLLNISSNIISNDDNILDIELNTNPLIPIDIYYINSTIYDSCSRICYFKSIQSTRNYIIRLNKYIVDSDKILNYSLNISCFVPYISTETYISTNPEMSSNIYNFDISATLSFGNRANILVFGVSVFIVLLFIFIGIIMHRKSGRKELQFIGRRSNWPFYICSILTLLISIIMCSKFESNQILLGILISLTFSSINFVSVIGMKYYRSFLLQTCCKINNNNKYKNKWTLYKAARYFTIFLAIFDLTYYYLCIFYFDISLLLTVLSLTYIELIYLSFSSFASKTAQIQWCILFILICMLHYSKYEEIYFDFYWYSILCIGCSLAAIFLFSRKLYAPYLRPIFINVFGAFISIMDIGTDIVIVILWISGKLYFWVTLQLVFIFGGTIYSTFYIDDYYFIAKGYNPERTRSDSNSLNAPNNCDYLNGTKRKLAGDKNKKIQRRQTEKAKRLFWGRIFTLLGLGRLYHGVVGWDEDRNKDMEIISRVIKIWEMCFEAFPTITLQTYLSLYTNLNINICLSVFASFASISFTFFRVLYGDHNSRNRKQEQIIAKRVERKKQHRIATISATLDFTLNQLFSVPNYDKHYRQKPSIPSMNTPKPMIMNHILTNIQDGDEESESDQDITPDSLPKTLRVVVDEVDELKKIPNITREISASALDFCHTTIAGIVRLGYDEQDVQNAYNKLKTNEKHSIIHNISVDDKEFEPVLLNILENEMKCEVKSKHTTYGDDMYGLQRVPSHLERAASVLETSDTMDNLWRNFICCIPMKLLVDCLNKKNDDNMDIHKKKINNMDKLFYFVIYVWMFTDFGCRIFPILCICHLRSNTWEFVEVAVFLGLFEFFMYYYMLSNQFKTPRAASAFFWTLYMTISYCLLSTMHIVHLPNNVIFNRLLFEHITRMIIQCGFMIFAMIIQHYQYGDALGFFKYSIIVFWCTLCINMILTGIVKSKMKAFKDKIISNMNLTDSDDENSNHHHHKNNTMNVIYESIDIPTTIPLKDSDEERSYSNESDRTDNIDIDYMDSDNITNDISNDTIADTLSNDISNDTINDTLSNHIINDILSDSEIP